MNRRAVDLLRAQKLKLSLKKNVPMSIAILSSLALIGGCAGLVNGKSSTQPSPPGSYSVSGTISPAEGGSGTTVSLGGASSATTATNASGNYSFTGLANGTYAVVPSHAGYTFSPTTQSATVNGANVTAINFTASPAATYSISGTITPAAGGSGATVTLSGSASATALTDSSGNYAFAGLASGTYVVTPANSGYTFSPLNQSVTINAANAPGVNFTAAPAVQHSVLLDWTASPSATVTGYNIYRSSVSGSGYVKVNPSTVGSLNYTDTTVQNSATYYYVTTAVDALGDESVYSNEIQMVIP
jgi:Carboxypeptidase regulatory-like domain